MALGALDIIIAADTAQLRKGMDTAVGIMQSSTKTMENVAKTAAGAIAGYFTFSAIKDSITQTLDLADSLGKLNQKVGISVDLLYSMQAQAKLSDVEFQTLEKSLLKFNKGLGTASMGSGDTTNALKNLNIELKDSSGHLKTSDQYLFEVADRFKGMPDGIAKSTLAMQLFGKSGADMIPLLNGGSESLKEFTGVMDNETAKSAERLNDSFTRMELSFEGNKTKILTGMLPAIESLSGSFESFAVWMSAHEDDVKSYTDRLGRGFTALGMVGHDAFGLISDTSTDMLKVVNGVFSAIPNMIGESSNDSINNFGFFEYFILGLSTATNRIRQFIANAKMAYADVAEFKAKYGSIGGLITNGGYDAASARLDKAYAKADAEQATNNVVDTYNTLLGLKKQFVAKSIEIKAPPFVHDLEDYAKNEAAKTKTAKDAEARLKKEHDDRVKAMDEINKKTANAQKYEEYQTKVIEDRTKLEFEADQASYEAQVKYLNEQRAAQLDYYTQIDDYSTAFVISEADKLQKLADSGALSNEQMLTIWAKDNDKFQKEQWDRDHKFWADTFVNINKAMDDQFFNAMSGKFTNFGNWLKDFWGSITQSMTRGLSKSLADTIMGTGNNSEGGIANWFKSYGGFSGVIGSAAVPAALAGATTSGGLTTTVGGTVLDSAGKIVTSGSDSAAVMDALNNASSLNTMYNAATGALSSSVADGFASLASTSYNLTGSSALAGGIGNFGAGLSTPFAGYGAGGAAGIGSMVGGAAIGAVGGYALGSIGDKFLGADTKAANYGAIGGATGAIVGSVVPVIGTAIGAVVGAALGSLIGGAFGKTKTSVLGSGVQFWDEGSASNINASSYVDMMSKTKSWFKSSERHWTEYAAISESDQLKIKKTFEVYNYLLLQLDKAGDVTIAAGKYAGSSFQDAMAKGFITNFTNINTSSPEFAKIYSYWTAYASEISKTVAEALTTSVGEYITTTRSFNEWKLGSGSMDQLKFTADYLAKDFNILSDSMGVSGLTVQNYLQKYDEAIKTSFSPETITTWKNLGNALMSATDANSKYVESLKNVQNQILPQDMMLQKTGATTTAIDIKQLVNQQGAQTEQTSQMVAQLYAVVKILKQQYTLAQLGNNQGIPA